MASEEQDMPTQQINTAKWWLALLGMVLFSITVAPDYPIQHVVLGLFIVIAIHCPTSSPPFSSKSEDKDDKLDAYVEGDDSPLSVNSTSNTVLPVTDAVA